MYFDAGDGVHWMDDNTFECILSWLEMRIKFVFGVNRCKNKTLQTIKSYFYEKRYSLCVRGAESHSIRIIARHPNRLQCSFIIREWFETYHCLFMHSYHHKMHFHARQHPIYCRIAKIPPPTTATAIITGIVDIGILFKCISYNRTLHVYSNYVRCVVSFEVRLCSATVAIATERMSTVAHTIWILVYLPACEIFLSVWKLLMHEKRLADAF